MSARLSLAAALLSAVGLAGCGRSESPPAPPAAAKSAPVPAPAAAPLAAAAPAAPVPAPAKARWPFIDAAESASAGALDQATSMRRNYYVVFDASGSMHDSKCSGGESKIDVAKRALVEFSGKLPRDVNFGLSVFDSKGIREIMPLRPIQAGAVAAAIDPILAGGGTPLAESIRRAAQALTAQGRRQFGYGEFHLVVITDGEATGENPKKVVNGVLAESPIVLHTIGFCIGENHSLNQPGRVVYRSADNPAELARGLAEVLAESPAFSAQAFK